MRARIWLTALLVLWASAASAQYFGKNKVRYNTFQWKEYATPHFRISYYDRVEPQLEKIASFAESAYDELARRLNFQIPDPIPIIAYATHTDFEQTNVIVQFIPEGVGAFATPARNRMVLPVDMPDMQLQQLLQHELVHIFQYEIFFQGGLGRAIASRPPLWFMEGMASYLAQDEDSRATAVMRDAALADQVPSVTSQVGGYLAYRFGHKVFEFVEAEWGLEGLRDFIFEFRNAMGGNVERPLKRAFDLDVDEFDARFRSWLRRQYQEVALDRGDPREFGPAFRVEEGVRSVETSPVASPSGDLIAAFSTHRNDVDVVLLGVPDRKLFRNLTRGYTTSYQYLIAQLLTVGPDRGRDIAFSPQGDTVAVFARKERGRVLLLLDVFRGGIRREIHIPLDQAMQPAFSPDGRFVAFHAFDSGQGDIFLLDLTTEEIHNLTADTAYDSSPWFHPNGTHLVYSSQSAEFSKLFELSLADPSQRRQLTFGPGDDEGASFSSDGHRLFFASDRDQGIFDIYALDMEDQSLSRLTKVLGAALNPVAVPTLEGERVVYQAYTKGRWWLYLTDPAQGTTVDPEQPPAEAPERETYVPAVTVTIDPERATKVTSRKFFVDDVQILVGVNEDQTLISQSYLSFSDHYGDRRLMVFLESVSGFSNFALSYARLDRRFQWGGTVFDNRAFWVGYDQFEGREVRLRRLYRETGAAMFAQYPISLYHRVEGSFGFIRRDVDYPISTPEGLAFFPVQDNIPFVDVSLVGDTTLWQSYGPHAGRRWQLTLSNSLDGKDGGTLSRDVRLDMRQYVPISRRTELALRVVARVSDGNRPNLYYFGGLDTLRGYNYRSLVGNRTGYVNLEWRFPLVDFLALPFLQMGGIRGRVFVDVGAAWFDLDDYKQSFRFMEDGRFKDGLASYGFGLSANLLGLPMHWDFSKRWDGRSTLSEGYRTTFWVGYRY